MAEYYVSDIIQSLKTLLKDSASVANVNTWKLGVLSPTSVFPALTIIPVREQVIKYFSNGMIHTNRVFDIEIYTKGFQLESIQKQNRQLVNGVETCLKENANWTLEGESFSIVYEKAVTQTKQVPNSNNHITVSIIRIGVYCKNRLYNILRIAKGTADNYSTNLDSASQTLVNRIYEFLNNFRTTFSSNVLGLSSVRALEKESLSLNPVYPAITIEEPEYNITHKYAGGNEEARRCSISVWTKALVQEEHLITNLELTTKIMKLVLLYPYFSVTPNSLLSVNNDYDNTDINKKITDTVLLDIDYTITDDYTKYRSNVNINVLTRSSSIMKTKPSAIGGLLGWYRASDLNLSNTNPVTTWYDLSGNNKHFISDGAPPTFKAVGDCGKLKATVQFDGSQYLVSSDKAFKFDVTSQEYSIFMVFYTPSATADNQYMLAHGTNSDVSYGFLVTPQDKVGFQQGILHSSMLSSSSVSGHKNAFIGKNTTSGCKGYLNGANEINSSVITQILLPETDTVIGARRLNTNTDAVGFFTGQIADIAIYDHALSDTEILLLNDYVYEAYGI